jgi:gliding motility-associated-like protein
MKSGSLFYKLCILLIGFLFSDALHGQCTTPIAVTPATPYIENFEAGPAWTTGGTENDWAWGTPTKTVINSAGSGTKCWIVGGLAINAADGKSYYNHNEKSWVQSPCLNFSALQYPFIAFLYYRESEWKYDGTNLQYSLDQGTTWVVIGTAGETVDCMDANWYNRTPITYLTTPLSNIQDGWCGNIQTEYTDTGVTCGVGNGSNGWIQAKHCLSMLAGQPTVLLRFTFGAGTSCNNFDGIAFDSVAISESTDVGSFTYACTSSTVVSFTGTSASACATTYSWNFGDAGSGASNTGSGTTATHTFSAPGTYSVSLIVSGGPCNAPDTTIKKIDILGLLATPQNGSCAAGGNISLTVTPTTGTGAYTYNWGGGVTTQNRTNLSAGTYTVTVTDPDGCSNTATATITSTTAATVSATGATVCNGSPATVTTSVSQTGGTYAWSPGGQTTAQITVTPATTTTYTVTYTLAPCNPATATATVTVNSASPAVHVNDTTICNAGTAVVYATVTGGGTGAYLWNTGATTASITVTPGATTTYSVTFTEQPCGSATGSGTVTVNSNPQLNVNSPSICSGGSAILTANASPAGGTYGWSTGAGNVNSISVSPTTNTTYTVTYTTQSCGSATMASNVTVITNAAVTVTDTTICPGGTGTITATATVAGGTYSWSPGNYTTQSITVTPGGTTVYTVTFTPVGCPSATNTGTVTVETPPAITLTERNPTCSTQGEITATATLGTTPYEYSLGGGAYQEADSFNNLAGGNYTVVVKDTLGCLSNIAGTTIVPYNPLTLALTVDSITCSSPTGQIIANATGGVGTLQYAINGGAFQASGTFSGLAMGTYIIEVEDGVGCNTSDTAKLLPASTVSVNPYADSALCYGTATGKVIAPVSGGSPPYQYALNGGTYQSQDTFNNLATGNYTVQVEDANGCIASGTTQVFEPTQLQIVSVTAAPVKCPGQNTGTITVVVSGGTTPYNYASSTDSVNFEFTSGNSIIDLDTGHYWILVADGKGCTIVSAAYVPGAVPDSFLVVTDSTSCFGNQWKDGSLTITGLVPQNGPFQYSLNGGPFQSSPTFSGLASGPYQIEAMDTNGCKNALAADTVFQPAPSYAVAYPADTTVNLGQALQLNSYLTGGAANSALTYSWSPWTGLSCIDCPNPVFSSYAEQNNYTVTITYNGQCTAEASVNIFVNFSGQVYIPNCFTPNGDGNNDVFEIYGHGIERVDLRVFNRWGEKVFESHNQFQGWDGTYKGVLQMPSVFVYEAEVYFLDSSSRVFKGSVTLVR